MLELLQTNTTISHYRILQKLGAGGMGEVYLAQDTKLDRKVALKILPADVVADKTRMRRFVQEARAASALNHPNIITIHEIVQFDSVNFIATEFIDGETLRQQMRQRAMKLSEVLDIVAQVANALSAAHAANIVHRDIKPENIMLRRDGIVKVLDFGLVKLTEQQESVNSEAPTSFKTGPGTVVGTATYMSPEQARGTEIDARTDIFSLGTVLYEMVAGRLPFEGSSSSEVLASLLSEKEPQPLARYSTDVPVELERIVSKALRKNREERYQTIKDLLLDLKSLKEEVEFQKKLERSVPSHLKSAADTGEKAAETVRESSARATVGERGPTSGIELNKTRVLIGLAALLIIGLGVGAYLYLMRSRSGAISSIAVLPFVNASADPEMEYFSDGIAESLINNLSQLPNVKVMSRNSVFRYKGKEMDAQTVGRELGVQALLSGRVVRRGDDLSINVELVDARDKTQIWGEQYNRKAAEVLAVQQEIAREISEKLQIKLTAQEQKQLIKRYTENIDAYEAYLKGRYYWNKRTEEDLKKGIEYFQQAIEKDPRYALAYAGLADSYILFATYNILPPTEAIPKARRAAVKALEIDDNLAEAHISLATIEGEHEWNWSIAEKEFQQAIKINPNYATAHQWYGEYLVVMGRFDEALVEIKRAHQLDPLSLVVNIALGDVFYYTRRYDEAITQYGKTLEIDPNFGYAYSYLGSAYLQKALYAEAIAKLEKARELSGGEPLVVAWLGYAFALAAERDRARDMLDELRERSKREYISPYYLAIIHVGLGEKDQAFEYLEKAYQERSSWLLRLKVEPKFDSLRSDQRFADLVRRVGLPQ